MKSNLGQIAPAIARKPIHVLYDRATDKFKPTTINEKQELYKTINLESQLSGLALSQDRPALLLSSTSYTPDEDFMILVKALDIVDKD